ncbi:hypothetical protein DICVIV_04491 [Dictyocaulus viviparus]|uniref:Uncharacterized protein n=1 Tax=Dictyocaulus viviparus TaxID=29172 RepID=A0A0D8Y463_DICVI|nr:hypothetical protein DICVIV_04491 [Dictyocaulus viviparus]
MSVSECVWGYRNGNFRTPHITCLETPPNSRSQINALIGFLIAVHITALLGIVFIYYVHRRRFRNGNFRTPHITCLETPPNSRSQINALIGFLIAVHITALLGIVFIYYVHRRRFRLVQSLSVRFQFSENLTSSRLIIALSTLQLMTFLMYGMAKVYLNSTHNPQKDDIPSYHSNMLAIYLISEYTLLLPLITMLFLMRAKQTRQSEIRSMIQVKASGAEGWANYSNQLQQQWNC